VVVEENNLQVHISALRKVLDPEDMGRNCIVTVPGRGYRLIGFDETSPAAGISVASPALTLPDKPSLAVLPFQNMSGDPAQEYFADGMAEEITTAIARLPWLFVIARNSSFIYKGRAVEVTQVARELGVRYVLQGSVRKDGNRVRISGQLIDAASGAQIWGDRFDGSLDDIFALQDHVASSVAGAVEPRLRQSEIERAGRKPTENLDAYDLYLRALAQSHRYSEASFAAAVTLLREALAIDPSYAPAAALVGWCHVMQQTQGWGPLSDDDITACVSLARQALEAEHGDADTAFRAAHTLVRFAGEMEEAAAVIDRALMRYPNSANAWMTIGWLRAVQNQPEAAIEALNRALRLSPFAPMGYLTDAALALAHLVARHYEEAIVWADRALHDQRRVTPALRAKVVALAWLGRIDEARTELHRLLAVDPTFTVARYRTLIARSYAPEFVALMVTGFRKAGLSEE
jgi:TolB-like protein/tetratricopeptide (TPR) repeat protein